MTRRAARVDDNQKEIVATWRKAGASVQHLHGVGEGCPDLLVGFRGKNYLAEIKDGKKPPSKRKLRPGQVEWHDAWRGEVHVITSVEEALAMLGLCQTIPLRGSIS